MKSYLFFLAATVAAGTLLIFSTANAQELPTVLHAVRLQSTKVSYDPLLMAALVLSSMLAIGKISDLLPEFARSPKETVVEA